MTVLDIRPGTVHGRVRAPASKSYTHRALVVGHLAGRRFRIRSPLDSADTRATAVGLGRLGTPVTTGRTVWVVRPGPPRPPTNPAVDCGESGTTLRFLAAVAARSGSRVTFSGEGRLGSRPMAPLIGALRSLGASIQSDPAGLPLVVRGPIRGGKVALDASTSSQFVSSLLLTLPTVTGRSDLVVGGEIVSAPYIDATLEMLRRHRVRFSRRGRHFLLPGGQRYLGDTFDVPGDASSAAYLWAAASMTGGRVRVDGIDPHWPQADRAILPLLRRAGAEVRESGDSATVEGAPLRPFSVDLTDAPDLYPLAGVLASLAPGTSRLKGAPHIVHKESDRRAGTIRLARAFGATVRPKGTVLEIEGRRSPRPVELPVLTDHRLVMSAVVGALGTSGRSRVGVSEATHKSFPGFIRTLRRLGAEVSPS